MIRLALAGLRVTAAWLLSSHVRLSVVQAARDAIFGELRDGLFVLDAQGRVADLNRTAERIVGRSAADMLGHLAAELFAGRLQPIMDSLRTPSLDREVELARDGEPRV